METLPGIMTPTEAFAALAAGARRLKLFPAATLGPGHCRALCEVMPAGTGIWAVGGVDAASAAGWIAAGAQGIGTGSSVYRPGFTPETVGERARALIAALHRP